LGAGDFAAAEHGEVGRGPLGVALFARHLFSHYLPGIFFFFKELGLTDTLKMKAQG
jgi:hypothetical protein